MSIDLRELEVKILDIDIEEMKKKLSELGAEFIEESFQKIQTYDFYDVSTRYNAIISEIDKKPEHVSINRLKSLFNEINQCLSKDYLSSIKKITSYENLSVFANKITKINDVINILKSEEFINIINSTQAGFSKWIRLRKTNDKTELTIKQIYSQNNEYSIDNVKEVELIVNDFDMANLFLNELGYGNSRNQEKIRISYKLGNVSIELDRWPEIPPYMEIEGPSEDEIFAVVEKLGFQKENVKVMNTDTVYTLYGLNIYDYVNLTFENPN